MAPGGFVGHRCLTRGLSDIAAMGGVPVAAFLSLALPAALTQRWVDQFLAGLLHAARAAHVTLAGGDISQSPTGIMADITVMGTVEAGRAIRRTGAQAGDAIYVSGELGAPVALLEQHDGRAYAKVSREQLSGAFLSQGAARAGALSGRPATALGHDGYQRRP